MNEFLVFCILTHAVLALTGAITIGYYLGTGFVRLFNIDGLREERRRGGW